VFQTITICDVHHDDHDHDVHYDVLHDVVDQKLEDAGGFDHTLEDGLGHTLEDGFDHTLEDDFHTLEDHCTYCDCKGMTFFFFL
jgi:hypothetical protein